MQNRSNCASRRTSDPFASSSLRCRLVGLGRRCGGVLQVGLFSGRGVGATVGDRVGLVAARRVDAALESRARRSPSSPRARRCRAPDPRRASPSGRRSHRARRGRSPRRRSPPMAPSLRPPRRPAWCRRAARSAGTAPARPSRSPGTAVSDSGLSWRASGYSSLAARLPPTTFRRTAPVRARGCDRRLPAEPRERQRPLRVDLADPRRLDRRALREVPEPGGGRAGIEALHETDGIAQARPSSRAAPRAGRRPRRDALLIAVTTSFTGALFSTIPTIPTDCLRRDRP